MENTLIIITVALAVVFIVSLVRYLKKDTFLSLILYLVSSIGICALEIAPMLIDINLDHSYVHALVNACLFAANALLAAFFMGNRFCRKENVEVTIRIIDTDESNDNKNE